MWLGLFLVILALAAWIYGEFVQRGRTHRGLGMAAALVRIGAPASLSVWPMWDDGHYSFFAVDLFEKWHWQMFFGSEQYMPVYTWLQTLYYKLTGPSLFSMRTYPALYSAMLPLIAWWVCRQFFSRSFSFIYFLLIAFSFWPIFISCFSTDIGINLLWQFLVLFVLFKLLTAIRSKPELVLRLSLVLGFCLGFGWYLSKFWLSSLFFFFIAAAYSLLKNRKRNPMAPWAFLISTAAPLIPMFFLILSQGYGGHLQDHWVFTHINNNWYDQWIVWLSYLTMFFWGSLERFSFHFDPLWGGFLNPILVASFLLGTIELLHSNTINFRLWIPAALAAFLSQGLLSNSLEAMRVAPLLPFLFFPTAMGFQVLAAYPQNKKSGPWILAVLGFLSLGLDAYHLGGPYHQWAIPGRHNQGGKSAERYRAFGILKKYSEKNGPGLILDNLIPDVFDQTMLTAAYPFNAARNPQLINQNPTWTGLLSTANNRGYLKALFPKAACFELADDLRNYDEGLDLFLVPMDGGNQKTLLKWTSANQFLQKSYPLIPYHVYHPSYAPVITALLNRWNDIKGDPYLESCFLEKIAYYQYEDNDGGAFVKTAASLLGYGRPQGKLYFELGSASLEQKNKVEAVKYFKLAETLNPRYQPSPEISAK